jgi:nucleotide-binding universal stress UspA family protein
MTMAWKSLLVHVDDAPSCRSRLAVAVRLARDFAAGLVGVYLVRGTTVTPSGAALLPPDVAAARLDTLSDAQNDAEAAFRAQAAEAGIRDVSWRAPTGAVDDAMVLAARCSDVAILSQQDPNAGGTDTFASTVILGCGRPTLVVPYIGAPSDFGERVLVAWDGGREATRAVADAMPLLVRARQVDVISVDNDNDDDVPERLSVARLAGWLAAHGVHAQIDRQESGNVGIGEWLLSRVADLQSTLVVMGGYGHARLRQLVLGGATRTMLRSMTIPVLFSH